MKQRKAKLLAELAELFCKNPKEVDVYSFTVLASLTLTCLETILERQTTTLFRQK